MPMFTNEDIVTGSVAVTNFPATQPVTGPLTDAELRATPVPVTIPTPVPVTDNGGSLTVDGAVSITGPVAVTGGLTDAELRASAVPISGTVAVSNFPATQAVTGTFWQATQPVSLAVAPVTPVTGTFWQAIQPVSGTVSVDNFPGVGTGTAVVTRVATTTTAVELLAANIDRESFVIMTETGTTYVKLGAGASVTDYTARLPLNTIWEYAGYKGIVSAIRSTGTGFVQVTELE